MKHALLIFFFAVVATIGSIWICLSDGFYYMDECAHFVFSRFIMQALPRTAQTWHRPIPQWLFALPAQFGHSFTMFFAFAVFLGLLFITYRIAMLKGIRHAEWVVIIVGLQPILFDLSYACMTEMPTAFVMALSYLYYLKGKHEWSMAIASAVIMCRTEMYVFAGLMFCIYAWRRKWKILPLVLVGPLIWIGSSTLISGSVMTFFAEMTNFSKLGKVFPGVSVTHYIANLHTTFGYAQFVLFVVGVVFIDRAKRSMEFGICYSVVAITVIVHTLAGAEIFHWTPSIGELRYLTVAGPFFGIVSVYGLSELLERIKLRNLRLVFSLFVFGVMVFNCTMTTHPRRWPVYEKIIVDLTKSIHSDYPNTIFLNNHSASAYTLDQPPIEGPQYAPLNAQTLKKYSRCIVLWDPFASNSIFSQTRITKDKVLQDTSLHVIEKRTYWSAEYFVFSRNIQGDVPKQIQMLYE